MQRTFVVYCSIAGFLITPSLSWASALQDSKPASAAGEKAPGAAMTLGGCRGLTSDRSVANVEKKDYKAAHDCGEQLKQHLQTIGKGWMNVQAAASELGGGPLTTDVARQRYLIRLHSIYRQVKQRVEALADPPNRQAPRGLQPPASEALALIDYLDDLVHDLMGTAGIRERVAAAVDSGVSFAEAGDDEVRSGRDATVETRGRGLIRWETEHFHDDQHGLWDFSAAGAFGFIPVLTLVSVNPGTGTGVIMREGSETLPQPFATYFSGLTWDVAPRLNLHFGERSELSLLGRFGQTWVTSDIETFQRRAGGGTTQVVMSRLRNGTGRVARFWEAGFEFRLHGGENRDLIHHEKSYLNPAASFALGYRRDARFSSGDQLVGTDGDRVFVRLALSLNRFVRVPADSKITSLQFGVDMEHSLSDNVPSGVRLFIGPDINVVKLLRADAQ